MKQLSAYFAHLVQRSVYAGLAIFLICMTSAPYAFADSTDPSAPSSSASCTPVTATQGIDHPTGSDAATFTYNKCTGLWENQYYTWSPATKVYAPKTPYVYTCDTKAWDWTYNSWIYNAAKGAYVDLPLTTAQLPHGAIIAAESRIDCTPPPPAPTVTTPSSTNNSASSSLSGGSNVMSGTENSTTGLTVTNQIGSTATTGGVTLLGNTTGGNVTSGDANVTANVVNNVASSSSLSGGNVVTFTANVNGDVQGDLIIDPSQIQPASNVNSLGSGGNVTVNSQTNGALTNNITLAAASGNASAQNNTTAGNVTTGNAQAIADVVNILDSVVRAGKSFVGVININGNLHGNILMPQSFLDQLLATNAPHTSMSISSSDAATLGINNTVTNTAASGSAAVSDNTTAGNVGSGNASTAVTIFNLTGSQIVGSNCLLVFVNVSGQWVGVIMNAPSGTTAAALGENTTDTTASQVNATTNDSITNNVAVGATTGNASASGNTTVGSVKSGNASTVVNLLNLNNTQLNLSGWFGVLFINVFGDWFGNFGVYVPPAPATSGGQSVPADITTPPSTKKVFTFLAQAHTAAVPRMAANADVPFTAISAQLAGAAGQTLGASVRTVDQHWKGGGTVPSNSKVSPIQIVGALLVAFGATTWSVERIVSGRRSRNVSAI